MVKTKEKIKVIIADDHPLFRRGLKNAFSDTPDIEVIAEAENGDDLLKKIPGLDPSIALVDVAMPGKNGLDLLKQLREEQPKLPVLVLTVYPEEHYAVRFFKAGASGFITKESSHRSNLCGRQESGPWREVCQPRHH